MKFLWSRHVLALLLSLLAMELGMRLGVYEPLTSPSSHSGVTIKLKNAMREFGKGNVNVVTFGDSRALWGLDNRAVFEASRKYGINHLRMSMPGSHFLTFKTLADWSLAELPELKGMVFALSTDAFGSLGNGAYELAEVLPLRNHTSTLEMLHHVPFNRSDLRTYAPFFSIAGYREDIRELLADPELRIKALSRASQLSPLGFLAYTSKASSDICAVATNDPEACLAELQHVRGKIPQRAWNGLEVLCEAATRGKREFTPTQATQELIEEWTLFLENLSHKVRVMVVLLPDHSLFMKHLYSPGSAYVGRAVLSGLQHKGAIELVDLHEFVMQQSGPECSYYMDARHLSKLGQGTLTRELLPRLQSFWSRLDGRGQNRP